MKTLIFSAVFLGVTAQVMAQDILYESKVDKSEVPDVVIKAIEKDFPEYVISDYIAQPVDLQEAEAVINKEVMPSKDYDYYKITLKGTGNKIESNMELDYDTDGNLIKSTEHIKNFAPPETIRYALANSYPGWTLKKDAFDLIQFKDGKEKEHYQLTLAKNGREIKVYTDIDGNLLNNKTNS